MSFATGTPTVEIELDKPRRLAFTLGAMQRIQERLGKTAFSPAADDADHLQSLPVYVWACLPAQDRKEIDVEEVADLLHPGNMAAVSEAIAGLFLSSTGAAEGAEGNAGKQGKAAKR